jgi:hypothetical protein
MVTFTNTRVESIDVDDVVVQEVSNAEPLAPRPNRRLQ